ncbi:Ppx/GppA phosphatase family-domain-containing protein [Limtongia smithiae]|uniref:Ppx/GppA phosphatase family-domain-containing protein n=1 Tax=Limtongia smithiae TaxID=1125753 RepID=UPI0034CF1D82
MALEHLEAVADIGSNAIRFAIYDLSIASAARNLPLVFQDRAKISLYDALASANAGDTNAAARRVPADVLERVRQAFCRFDVICGTFGVPPDKVFVFGTEAARSATNSAALLELLRRVNSAWTVTLLSPEDEARFGALGIASSYHEVAGIVMDLGGGSVQISWASSMAGKFVTSERAVSLPYGAAALMQRMKLKGSTATLKAELASALHSALKKIRPPFSTKGASLYLSGGGFRALACVSMAVEMPTTNSDTESLYAVPIVNGYRSSLKEIEKVVAHTQLSDKFAVKLDDLFRISNRRASQLPAIFMLVQALIAACPQLGSVHFCQGGVKEGYVFSKLDDTIKWKDPLITCTSIYARPASDKIQTLLSFALSSFTPVYISKRILPAVVNCLYAQSSYTKDTQATVALNMAVSGSLAGAYGLTHVDRALLGIILCERWGGDVFDERVLGRLCDLVVSESSGSVGLSYIFWGYYIAKIATIVAELFPAGIIDDENRIKVKALHDEPDNLVLELTFRKLDPCRLAIWDTVLSLEKRIKKFRKKYDINRVPIVQFRFVLV